MTADLTDPWSNGRLALRLLALDPAGLGGLHLRARASTLRDRMLADLGGNTGPARRITPMISDTQLFGGVDIAATLGKGAVVHCIGLLAKPGPVILAMAERCEAGLAARLSQVLDRGDGQSLILLDEGAEPDETCAPSLLERVAFSVSLDGLRDGDCDAAPGSATDPLPLSRIALPDDALIMLTVTAARFGIDSLRAPLFALRAARAHAALMGRTEVSEDDLRVAVQLVYPQRATLLPQDAEDQTEPDTPDPSDTPADGPEPEDQLTIPEDMLIEAVRSILPTGLLQALQTQSAQKGGKGAGAGQKRKGNRRGRPLPSRPGRSDGQNRIDLIATLRAAAPWQAVRRKLTPGQKGLLIRPSDIHVRRFQERSDRLIIFTVDASGSSAVARLAEAKGAVELMLAEAYARRDHVALIAFRGDGAEIILPPTRSLVQTKRRLAGVPGGGGTPLAAGLKIAAELASRSRGQGLSPALALLTDGRANVPLPGRTGRAAASEDATSMAVMFRSLGLPSAVVDTSVRPHRDLQILSVSLGGTYVPLPRADARGLSRAIGSALTGP